MKIAKFIHVLLIALLCYGNLVANVHVIGHMHLHEDSGTGSATFDDCSAMHGGTNLAHSASEHHGSTQKDGDNNTENNCAIYHTLLSLSGVLCIVRHEVPAPLQFSAPTACSSTYIAGATPDYQQIRAPPAHS